MKMNRVDTNHFSFRFFSMAVTKSIETGTLPFPSTYSFWNNIATAFGDKYISRFFRA